MLSTLWRRLSNGLTQNATAAYFRAQALQSVQLRGYNWCPEKLKLTDMHVEILPALQDSYMFLIVDIATNEALAIDPVVPDTIIKVVERGNYNLTKILTTHFHINHASGNQILKTHYSNGRRSLDVLSGDKRVCSVTHFVKDNEKFNLGQLQCTCIFTPGHTDGGFSYYFESPSEEKVVFTGDTLLQGGCGKFFKRTSAQMYKSLNEKLACLPDETLVFSGHEDAFRNLTFAQVVEPNNRVMKSRLAWVNFRKMKRFTSLPSSIGHEKQWNPFIRVHLEDVQKYAGEIDPIKVLMVLQNKKEEYLKY